MAAKLIKDNINVTAICPGAFQSDMNTAARDHGDSVAKAIPSSASARRKTWPALPSIRFARGRLRGRQLDRRRRRHCLRQSAAGGGSRRSFRALTDYNESWPGLTRPSIVFANGTFRVMDTRVARATIEFGETPDKTQYVSTIAAALAHSGLSDDQSIEAARQASANASSTPVSMPFNPQM
jgi:NAD(P)-dependent dehydrogenase (short-subunit alcohol dehydrogenase family)